MSASTLLNSLGIKIYADGADLEGMKKLAADPLISGLTTNEKVFFFRFPHLIIS